MLAGMRGPIGGDRAMRYVRSAELSQMERPARVLVMFVGRSAVALDLRIRANDRHVVAPRLSL